MASEPSPSAAAQLPDYDRLVADYRAAEAKCEEAKAQLEAARRKMHSWGASGESNGNSHSPMQSLWENAKLSDREREVFELIGKGHTTGEIAERLQLSTSTVETYRERLKDKLKVRTGVALIRQAVLWSISQEGRD